MIESQQTTRATCGNAAGLRTVILAGGKGTRLRPFTVCFPKPMVPLGDTPVLEVLIGRLVEFGIRDITLNLGYLAQLVTAYFDSRTCLKDKIDLRYVREEEPTGTAGSLAMVEGLQDTFLVMNGDLLTDLNFDDLVSFHKEQGAMVTIATHTRKVKVDFGVLELNGNHELIGYREKPETTYSVSMGIYVLEPQVLSYVQRNVYLDFPDLVLRLIADGKRVCAFPTDCLWLDIGRPDDYGRAQDLFTKNGETFSRV